MLVSSLPEKPHRLRFRLPLLCCALALAAVTSAIVIPNLLPFRDATGFASTYNSGGPINEHTAFFQSFGTNGRSCSSCHLASDAMGLGVASVQRIYLRTRGHDPLFASFDGANCPNGSPTNPADHSLLLSRGLIRIPLVVPAGAQFSISAVRDPYGCANVVDPSTGAQTISVYRRPLPTTNLRFLSAVMFDGRETLQPLTSTSTFAANLAADLAHQSNSATRKPPLLSPRISKPRSSISSLV